jgi:hypothetical protein
MSRWYSVPLLFLGVILIFAGVLTTEGLRSSPPSVFEYQYSPQGTSMKEMNFDAGIPMTRSALSILIQAGAASLLAGIFLFTKRFSLRWLLLGILAIALVSSYPFMRLDGNPSAMHVIRITRPTPVSADELAHVRRSLQPKNAGATLPRFQDEYGANLGVERVNVTANDNEICCALYFKETYDPEGRAVVERFFEEYATQLVCHVRPAMVRSPATRWESEIKAIWEAKNPL